jgi:hypothetical protein
MALNTLPAGAFADDAITSDKINLANTFAFTGTVTGAAKIGQVSETTFTLDQSITSTSYVELNTACRIALTPAASTSKFIFQVQFPYQTNDNNTGFHMIIYKDVGGGGYSSASGLMATHTGHDSSTSKYRTFSGQFLDAPSTTSAVTYTPYVKVNQNTIKFGDNGMYSAILMEVLG